MTLLTLQSRLKDARIERNSTKIKAISSAISDLQLAMGRSDKEFTEDQVLTSIRKTRDIINEQVEQIECLDDSKKTSARLEEKEGLNQQSTFLTSLLPALIAEETYPALAAAAVEEVGAQTIKDMGKVLAKLKGQYGLRIDAGKMSGIVKELLNK